MIWMRKKLIALKKKMQEVVEGERRNVIAKKSKLPGFLPGKLNRIRGSTGE
jgi:hypothetical protein